MGWRVIFVQQKTTPLIIILSPFISYRFMKKVLLVFIFFLATVATWLACTKESVPTVADTPKNEGAVSERTPITVTFSGISHMRLCGKQYVISPVPNPCTTCGGTASFYDFVTDPETVTLQDQYFCLTNSSGSSVGVTVSLPGCFPTLISVPPGTTCYQIHGCQIVTCW